MRRLLIILLCMSALLSSCHRQGNRPNEDTRRTDSLLSFYKDSMLSRPAQMKELLLHTRQGMTDSISYYKLTMFAGFCCYHNYQTDSAFRLNRETLAFCQRQDSALPRLAELEAYTYNYLSIMLQEANNRDSALICLHKAYKALSRADNREKLPDVCINLADNYAQNGNFPLAIRYYRKALLASDSLGMGEQLNHAIYCGMARIYTDINNFPLADHYYRLAEQSFGHITPYEQFFFANTRGNYYYITKEYPRALPWFYKANRISRNFKKQVYRAITESNLGEIYLLMGQTDSAECYLDRAKSYFYASAPDASTGFYFDGLYASLALSKNELNEAEKLLSKPYDPETINPTYVYLHDKRMEELYARKGDYKQAYLYGKRVQLYDDSLRNIKALNNIAEIDSRYRQDTILLKRDVVIAQKQAKVMRFRNLNILLVSLLVMLIMAIVTIIIYARRKREQRYAKQLATITKLRMENVRNRISPHFIFNTLNVVIPALRQYDDLARPLHLLVQSIRNNLLMSEKVAITLAEEMEIVRNFLDLKQSIQQEFPEIRWDVAGNVNTQTLIPSMIMQIPVENAIKYAFESYDENETDILSVTVTQDDKYLSIVIEDNGAGYAPGRFAGSDKGTGTGLKVLYRTIELLNTKNQLKIELKIENIATFTPDSHGTRVLVKVPVKYNYNL